jgi:hypothetical protein
LHVYSHVLTLREWPSKQTDDNNANGSNLLVAI